MRYHEVQASIEAFVIANWTGTTVEAIQFDNVAFDSTHLTTFLQCSVVFGDSISKALIRGCYRQIGTLFLTIYTRPAGGSQDRLSLASEAAEMVRSQVVEPVSPMVAPKVTFDVPSLIPDNAERDGWVRAQVSCPFYYDLNGV